MNPFVTQVFQHCFRCGSEEVRRPSERFVSCERCGLRFFFNPALAVVAVLRNREGDVLFVRRAKAPSEGLLSLPGGFVEYFETAEEAMAREIREELGLEIGNLDYLCSTPNTYEYGGITYVVCDIVFLCDIGDGERLSLNEENSEALFLPHDGLQEGDLAFESHRHILRRYGERLGAGSHPEASR